MALALTALIILGDVQPRLFGLGWAELCLRRVAGLAVDQSIVVATDRIAPDLVATLDRLRAEGMRIALVREASEVAERVDAAGVVLLLAGSALPEAADLTALLARSSDTIVCVEAMTGEHFERIDRDTRWGGAARIDGVTVRAAAASVGDWDLGSLLLRQAVQANAARLMLGTVPLDAADAEQARTIEARAVAPRNDPRGWGEAFVTEPFTNRIVRPLAPYARDVDRYGVLGSAALAASGVLCATIGWVTAAALLVLVAMIVAAVTARITRASGLRGWGLRVLPWVNGGAAALVALLASGRGTVLVVAIAAVALFVLLVRLPTGDRRFADPQGAMIVLALSALGGPQGVLIALSVIAVHAFASVFEGQGRLSGGLTDRR